MPFYQPWQTFSFSLCLLFSSLLMHEVVILAINMVKHVLFSNLVKDDLVCMYKNKTAKESVGSHQLLRLIFTKKESCSSSNTQSWETHEMHAFFWWYCIFARPQHFQYFSYENQDIYYFILKKTFKKNRLLSSLFNFFLIRTKTFIFRVLKFTFVVIFRNCVTICTCHCHIYFDITTFNVIRWCNERYFLLLYSFQVTYWSNGFLKSQIFV